MTSYSSSHNTNPNPQHHFTSHRRNSSLSPYAIPARSRSNSINALPYNIPENRQTQSYNPRFHNSMPKNGPNSHHHHPNNTSNGENVPLLTREFVVRRISEGESGRVKQELKCEACGKGYKHISSLAKHLWEHTAEWNYTKKLLISKHQQVQLLEAASILVSMNENDKKPDGEGNNSLGSSKQILSPTLAHKSPGHDQIMSPPSSYQKPVASGGYLDASKNENHIQGKHQSRDKSHEDEDYDADEGVFGELE